MWYYQMLTILKTDDISHTNIFFNWFAGLILIIMFEILMRPYKKKQKTSMTGMKKSKSSTFQITKLKEIY